MSEHEASELNEGNGKQVASRFARLPKNDSRYWMPRIFKPLNGRGEQSPHYAMKVQFKGRRMAFTLGTGNKEAAARKARDIYTDLLTSGVAATLVKHRTQKREAGPEALTVGDWITAAQKVFDGKPATFGGYTRALRFIASEILAVSKDKKRFGRTQAKVYRRKVDSIPLSVLTPEAIQAWRIRYVKRAGESPAKQRAARISSNSMIRQARALFSRKLLKFVGGVSKPDPLPFVSVEFFPRESMRYQSKMDPSVILKKAKEDFVPGDPEPFKVLLLALGGGLRRGEIDRLLWTQFDFTNGGLRMEATEAGGLKTEDSAGFVPLDSKMMSVFRSYKSSATGSFVIEEGAGITASKPWGQRYRCGDVFYRLTQWLRAHGVDGAKPLHTLRKEAGSIIATKAGIHAASRFLRHADIQVTSMHYADHKERVTVDMGALLTPENATPIKPKKSNRKPKAA